MNVTYPLAALVQRFFQEYMAAQKGLSPNTILSYRDALKLFLCFASQRVEKPLDKLVLEDFDEKLALTFLDDLETTRGNCTAARNNRLAAIRAFFRYVAGQEPLGLALRVPHKVVDSNDIGRFLSAQHKSQSDVMESPKPT